MAWIDIEDFSVNTDKILNLWERREDDKLHTVIYVQDYGTIHVPLPKSAVLGVIQRAEEECEKKRQAALAKEIRKLARELTGAVADTVDNQFDKKENRPREVLKIKP